MSWQQCLSLTHPCSSGLSPSPVRTGSRAFTLIEMLLVVTIIAILAGTMVVPLHGRRGTHALRLAAKDLAAAIRFAALQAKVRRLPHRVAFPDGLRSYRVEYAPSGTVDFKPVRGSAGISKPLVEGVRIVSVWSSGYEVVSTPNSYRFEPNGNGFFGRIELQNQQGRSMSIDVVRASGQVHVCE